MFFKQAKKNVFSGFAGFGARATPPSNAFNINFATKSSTSTEPAKTENGMSNRALSNSDSETNEKEYLANLKVLNETVTTWIADHVKKNPCCVLTPIFQDYEKHLKDLEAKRSSTSKESKKDDTFKTSTTFGTGPKPEKDDKKFQFGATTEDPPKPNLNFFGNGSTPAKPSPTFSFGATSTPAPSSTTSTFSFKAGQNDSDTAPPSSMFSFKGTDSNSTASSPPSSTAPFSFSATKPASTPTAPAFSFGFAR